MALGSHARQRAGQIGSTKVWLHRGRERPYVRRRVLILPDRQDVPGDPGKILLDPDRRLWHIDSWKQGEGEDLWRSDRDAYDTSTSVRPKRVGDGLVLGAPGSITQISTGGNFVNSQRLVLAHGNLYTLRDGKIARWDTSNTYWVALTASATTSTVTRACANTVSSTNYIYQGRTPGTLDKYNVGGDSWSTHVSAGTWSTDTVPIMFEGVLYALNDGDLYEVDQSTTNTVTQVYDETQAFSTFRDTIMHHNCLDTSDVGPIWAIRYEDGSTKIHQYNHFTQTHSVIGTLPPGAWPYSMLYAFGFTFIAYRQTDGPALSGQAYIHYVGNGISGVAGPIREFSSTTGETVQLAGALGDDIIFTYQDIVWAYNITNGGLSHIAAYGTVAAPEQALLFGREVFAAGITSSTNEHCYRSDLDTYTTTGQLDSGRYDMGYPGTDKILVSVTVTFEPLPTNTSVQLAYAVEGGSFTTHGTTVTGDGTTTSHTFTISDASASVIGRDFELRIILNSSDSTKTPSIRSITAEAVSAETRLEWQLELDAGSYEDGERATSRALADLDTLADTVSIVTFTDPWQVDEYTGPESFTVRLVAVETPEVGAESESFGTVVLRQV